MASYLSAELHGGLTTDRGLPPDTDTRQQKLQVSAWVLHKDLKSKCDSQSYDLSGVPQDESKLFSGRNASYCSNAGFQFFTPKLQLFRENNSLAIDFCISSTACDWHVKVLFTSDMFIVYQLILLEANHSSLLSCCLDHPCTYCQIKPPILMDPSIQLVSISGI